MNNRYPVALLILVTSTSGLAATITLGEKELKGRIAFPYEHFAQFDKRPQAHLNREVKKVAKVQAHMECMSRKCGSARCKYVVSETHAMKPVERKATWQVVNIESMDEESGSAMKFDRFQREHVYMPGLQEYYFQTIVCSDEIPNEITSHTVLQKAVEVQEGLQKLKGKTEDCSPEQSIVGQLRGKLPSISTVKELGSAALCLGTGIGIKVVADYFQQPRETDSMPMALCKMAIRESGFAAAVSKKVQSSIAAQRDDLMPDSLLDEHTRSRTRLNKRLKDLQSEFEALKKKHAILPQNEEPVSVSFSRVSRYMKELLNPSEERSNHGLSSVEEANEVLSRVQNILSMPHEVKVIDIKKVNAALDESMKDTSAELRKEIKSIAKDIAIASTTDASTKKTYYFLGSPGTGKSYLAKALTDALDVPVLMTRITDDGKFISDIDEFLAHNKYRNPLIFVEEAGDFIGKNKASVGQTAQILSLAKTLFDSQNPTEINHKLSIAGPNIKPSLVYNDTSKVTFVLTGNYEGEDDAVMSRMDKVRFPAIGRDERVKLAKGILERELKKYKLSSKNLSEQDRAIIEKVIRWSEKFDGMREASNIIENFAKSKVATDSEDEESKFDLERQFKNQERSPSRSTTPPLSPDIKESRQ